MNINDLEAPYDVLASDGDTHVVELDDDDSTLTYELTLEPDDTTTFEDVEDPTVFGKIECVRGGSGRPEGFDGAARKLHLGNSHPMHDDVWFQPPKDLKSDPDRLATHVRHVRDVLMYGYTFVVVTLTHELSGGYRRSWDSCLGGVEPFADSAYTTDIANDLCVDVTAMLKENAPNVTEETS